MRSYIPVNKDKLPEQFEIDLADETFVFEVHYNQTSGFFTVDLYDVNRKPIVLGEKLVLNEYLWEGLTDRRLPAPALIVLDESATETCITYENFMKTTFLYIDDVVPMADEPLLGDSDE
ncbi:phage baseplate plug family protein [Priestia flexa]|uniref:phage baseplate plug family protein n=1 Tax=Priestia flexa TaxID=86664 RepID=UPI003F82B18C